jgi:allantoate deiminase
MPPLSEAAEIMRRLDELATCTETPGEISRLFLTPAHAQAIALTRAWMQQAGLQTTLDPCGTLIGVLPGPSADAPVLLLGSHIDTVRQAGRYDGCLGVIIAIALAARARVFSLRYTIEIRAFGDEEGVRFPVTLTGAHATAGNFNPAWLAARDANDVTLATALENFGLNPEALAANTCAAQRSFAYLEIHIEQGPVLEAENAPLGVVTAINGATRFEVTVTGRAGHAGTVPMSQRQDALIAAAAMMLAIRDIACSLPNVVATVGRLNVSPGATNVIPGACQFTIDLRAPEDSMRELAQQHITAALHAAAAGNNVKLAIQQTHQAAAVTCDPRLQSTLAAAITASGLPVVHLPSGAGHDAMAIAALCPVGMLFVRCAGGISHHPDESVTESDVDAALRVMTLALQSLDPAGFAAGNTPA